MNRSLFRLLALAAGVASSVGVAQAQLAVTQPLDSAGVEVIGPNTVADITITHAGGAPAALVAATALTYQYEIVATTTAGGEQILQPFAAIAAAGVDQNRDGTFGDLGVVSGGATTTSRINFNLGVGGFAVLLNTFQNQVSGNPNLVALLIRLRVNAGANSVTTTLTPNANGTVDNANTGSLTVQNTPLTITSAFINTTGGNTFVNLVFNRSLSNGNAANDFPAAVGATGNQTSAATVGGLVVGNFQLAAASTFATPLALTGTLGASQFVAGSNNTAVQLTFTAAGNLAAGQFIRVNAANTLRDIIGNDSMADVDGQVLTALPTFNITSVRLITESAFFTGVNDARVTFSLPVNPADLGDFGAGATFYGQFLMNADGTPSNIQIVSVTPDASNNSAVMLGLATGGNVIHSDALAPLGTGYRLDTNVAGNVPSSIFAANDYTAAQMLTLTDGVPPTVLSWTIHDLNSDGKIDAVGFLADEPVTSSAGTSSIVLNRAAATVRPRGRVLSDGTLGTATVTPSGTAAENLIPVTAAAAANISGAGIVPVGYPTRLQTGNGQTFAFNPDLPNWDNNAATAAGSTQEAIPGTGGADGANPGAFITVTGMTAFTLTDGGGNIVTVAPFGATTTPNGGNFTDRAAPVIAFLNFLTGDNQDAGDANQYANEQDTTLGDGLANNSLVFVGSEAFINPIAVNGPSVGIGPGSITFFNNAAFGAAPGGTNMNLLTATNSTGAGAVASPLLVAGVAATIGTGSGITDVAGNETTMAQTNSVDGTAPYIPVIADVNGANIHSAFLEDTTSPADGFADRVRLTFTQAIDPASIPASVPAQVALFTLGSGATVTGVSASGSDVLVAFSGQIPMNSMLRVTYVPPASATQGIASVSGIRISALGPNQEVGAGLSINNRFTAQRIAASNLPTQELAFMDIVGAITRGTTPVPAGTKIYAMIAAPHIYSVTATHNNVTFTQNAQTSASSINAWNSWLFGVQSAVYLGRNDSNNQTYENFKDRYADDGDAAVTFEDVINLTINASNLTAITFTGVGETSADKVANGRALLCWDVLRATGGLVQNFYNPAVLGLPNTNGPQWGGQPIISSAVVTGTDGRYELHVSAPVSIFNGASRLNSVDRPVILIVEEPNGNRFAVSSVLTSINGAPVRFRHQSRSQTTGEANAATNFNVDLNNVGAQPIYSGWNLVGNNRNSGFATATNSRPVRVNGVSENAIIVPGTSNPALPFTGALEQFVYFVDAATVDGAWTRTENPTFSNIVIDPDCFPHFAFTMTSLGVQAGSSINNFVGGYALGFFNPGNFAPNLGCFQFGAPLTGNTLFSGADAATTFPNNATTQGWGLFTSKAAFSPATGIGGTNNPDLDYLFIFRNNGPNFTALNRTAIEVSSLDLLTPTGSDPNDTAAIDAGQPFFGHWLVP